MKTIGVLGGMGWESTAVYYRILNQQVRRRLGGVHSAHVLIESIDFDRLATLQRDDDWDGITAMLLDGARRLERAGADFWLMACNTVHRVSDAIEPCVGIPLLHIADPAGCALAARGLERVGLIGTRTTMEERFYPERLQRRFGIETLLPDTAAQRQIHDFIFGELTHGIVSADGRKTVDEVGESLRSAGAQGLLLACTELGLYFECEELSTGEFDGSSVLPSFDTAVLHAHAAVEMALAD